MRTLQIEKKIIEQIIGSNSTSLTRLEKNKTIVLELYGVIQLRNEKRLLKPLGTIFRTIPLVAGEDPTQDELKVILHYEPNQGIFIWKFRSKSTFNNREQMSYFYRLTAGKVAGTLIGDYPCIPIGRKVYQTKQLVWLYHHGVLPRGQIKELDGDKLNTRIENLALILSLGT